MFYQYFKDKTLVGHWYEKRIRPIIGSHDFKTSYGGQFQGYNFLYISCVLLYILSKVETKRSGGKSTFGCDGL